ncbi:MAG: transcriptional regulator [Candidatus Parabeggiatoa sp. nov. 3]|jgi:HTH-type transcriptional regulator/antitoxin HipB|nr:MAG: transcriptional regulator [Gammaproteobacteria bacterium]RKZ57167.1 MAG: transcriptional regulator [Gammaproteobacteria bacterium]RKZ85229.1 MAG: transcriptional regulator [Gammaproteobacteria bacterium]HEW98414.1 transcriptional regulator [Beggiatoa sp.]
MLINLVKDVGSVIRDARKRKGWNQTQLAQKVGVTQRKISVIENDPSKVDLGIILYVCSALELKLEINPISHYISTDIDW